MPTIANLYRQLQASGARPVIQLGAAGVAIFLCPQKPELNSKEDKEPDAYKDYLVATIVLAIMTCCIVRIHLMSSLRRKSPASSMNAFWHVILTCGMAIWCLFCYISNPPPMTPSSPIRTCIDARFASLECVPVAMDLILPVAIIGTLLLTGFTVYLRAYMKHRDKEVEIPPGPPIRTAAWVIADVAELDLPSESAKETVQSV
ncbi:hypothetical protein C8R44DRAFT_852959 [Mycena epipterygia]|nr:hypothetical protein C8R44DRAFT_852959 [Mycena epipterygia]